MAGISYVIDPEPVVNLATNPSGEVAKKFSVNGPDFVVTREASGTGGIASYSGGFRDKHAYDGAGADGNLGTDAGITFAAAGTYVASLYVWVPAAWTGGVISLTDDGTFAGGTVTTIASASLALRDQWQRISTRFVVVGGDLSGTIFARAASAPSSAPTGIVYSDAFQIEEASTPSSYFDGDSQSAQWDGTPHGSTSSTLGESSNVALTLVDNSSLFLVGEELPAPPEKQQWSSSVDTEGSVPAGEARHENRSVSLGIRVHGSSAANVEALVLAVSKKVEKLRREGGMLMRAMPSGNTYALDIVAGSVQPVWDRRFIANWRIDLTLSFMARPYWRTAWKTLSDHAETTNPELVFTESDVAGDVPALGRLVVDEDQGADQWFVLWGLQSRYYSSASTAALAYAATAFTALGTSTTAAGATGAFGGGSNVVRNTDLTTTYQAVLSTQATGGGSHLSHIGDFNVWARVYCPTGNTGDVKLALEWSTGDFRVFTRNADWSMDSSFEGSWRFVNLGQVHVPRVAQGTQRWEGRIVAKSTVAGDELDVNRVWVVPCSEGYGEARAVGRAPSLSSFSARDEFNQAAGALTGKTAAVGGAWAGAGDADDFAVEATGHTAQRTAVSDTATAPANGRLATVGSALTTCAVQAVCRYSVEGPMVGLIARYVDTSNFLAFTYDSGGDDFYLQMTIGGTVTAVSVPRAPVEEDVPFTMYLQVAASGQWRAGINGRTLGAGSDAALATGGTLASGKAGLLDWNPTATASTRNYDDFVAYEPSIDAAMFASQSLAVRNDCVIREDSGGTIWTPVSDYQGNYLQIQPTGSEGRTARFIVKASRNDPDSGADTSTDDLSARLSVAERFVHVPE